MNFNHSFPAVRGVQAGRPCYIAMCPMRIIPKLFKFDEEEVPPELRAQRQLNTSRIPEIANYLINHAKDYTLSSLTASIDRFACFTPFSDTGPGQSMGILDIPMDAQILINDGQHRRAAIEKAIIENPELGHENISVLFFIDEGLARSQQMFADLNKHAVRPSDSISTLYDLRDEAATIARHMHKNVRIFTRLTELERSSISNRSTKLFTLSAIKNATKVLLGMGTRPHAPSPEEREVAVSFWNSVAVNIPDWQHALSRKVAAAELREQYIHAHAVMLQAMGHVGNYLIANYPNNWQEKLSKLGEIDWARANQEWDNRALVHGRISKARSNVALTANLIKQKLDLPLTPSEQEIEEKMTNGL